MGLGVIADPCTLTSQSIIDVWSYANRVLTNISDLRASYIDELAPGNIPADIDILLTRISNSRALLLDNLAGVETTGTHSHTSGTSEQNVVEITPSELKKYEVLILDLNALAQNTNIKIYIAVDGTNYRLVNVSTFPTDYPTNAKGVPIELYPMSVKWKVSLTSAVAEGASRDVAYRYVERSLA